jgi:flagellin-like protein
MGNMKANRKFVNEEEAVSAVIGVILMVAITVAIAATVYVYVSGMLTPGSQDAPDVAFIMDDVANTLTCTKVSESGLIWSTDIVAENSTGSVDWTLPTGTVTAGDQITGIAGDVTVTVSYKGQTLFGTWTFTA